MPAACWAAQVQLLHNQPVHQRLHQTAFSPTHNFYSNSFLHYRHLLRQAIFTPNHFLTLDSLYTRQLFTTRTFYTTHLALPFSQRLHQTKFHTKCCPCHANPGPETDNRDAPEHSRTQADVGDTDNKQGAQVLRQDSNM